MKKTHLFILSVAAIMTLASCGKSSTPAPSSSEPDSSVEPTPETEHQHDFVREIANPSKTRDYNGDYDMMVDDFSGESINGTTTGVRNDNTLRVLVDSTADVYPTSDDASIYKVGTNYYDLPTYDGIGFKMRITGNKNLKTNNLILALRGDDSCKVYPISLGEAVNVDGEALPELSEEYQDFVVCPQLSIENGDAVYELKNGGDSSLKVLETMVGLHLYAESGADVSAVVEISEVYLVKSGEKTVIDNFSRKAVGKADDTCWWRDSTGFIVRKGLTLSGGATYTMTPNVIYSSLAVTVLGDTTGTTVNGKAWNTLVDEDGANVSNAVNGAFYSLTADVEDSALGYDVITIASTTEITISEVFMTNFEDPQPAAEYPVFDVDNMFVFDNFNRTQSGFNGDYDAAITDEQTLAAGLSYQLSYNNGDMVSVDGDALVFDASSLPADGYINYKACNDNLSGAYDYMIVAVKAEDGASLDNFRFNSRGAGVVYTNQMYSGQGLAVATLDQADYPYIKNGYTWLVIDNTLSGMNGTDPYIDWYYSGSGKLSVDFVAYANKIGESYNEEEALTASWTADEGYRYGGWLYAPAGVQYVKMVTSSSDATATIDSIRFETIGDNADTKWFHEGKLIDKDGNVIDGSTVVGEVTIDLVASGIKSAASDDLGFHVHGGASDGKDLSVTFYNLVPQIQMEENVALEASWTADEGYRYGGWLYAPAGCQYVKMETTSSNADATIDSIRFETIGDNADTKWFHEGKLVDKDGNVIAGDTKVGTVTIDLVASGIKTDASDEVGFHVHGGASDGNDISVKFTTLTPKAASKEFQVINAAAAEATGYRYIGGFDNYGANVLKLEITSTTASTLASFRLEAGTTIWFNQGLIKDTDGNVISETTELPAGETVTLYIDLTASGFSTVGGTHVHSGADGVAASYAVKASAVCSVGTSEYILFSVNL